MKQFSTSCIGIFALLGLAGTFAAETPYAGQQTRMIKALSDQEVSDYVEGRGMGSSKAAELNHYPGPAHVLVDSSRLELRTILTPEQIARYDEMRGCTAMAPSSSPSTEAAPAHQHMHH
jgi:hypothetical protein